MEQGAGLSRYSIRLHKYEAGVFSLKGKDAGRLESCPYINS
jgi:hypothetical protein